MRTTLSFRWDDYKSNDDLIENLEETIEKLWYSQEDMEKMKIQSLVITID